MLILVVVCVSLSLANCVPNGRRVLDEDVRADYGSLDCLTPDRSPGRCMLLSDCNSLMHLLEKPSRPLIAYLRNSTCGFLGSRIAVHIDQPVATFSWVCCPPKEPQLGPFKPPAAAAKPTNQPVTEAPSSAELASEDDLLPADCGYTEVVRDRIVGGQVSPKGAWPWMAMTIYRDNSTGAIKKWCGGTLISDRHVLTAAHCFHQFKRPMMMVRLGEHIFNTEDDEAILQDIPIARAIIHEKYNDVTLRNDIALLVLKHKIKMAENVQPICLSRDRSLGPDQLEGEKAFIAGWGRTKQNGNASLVLMEGMVPIIQQTQCKEAYREVTLPNSEIHHSVFCAGYAEGGVDSCQGDSGGPLMLPLGQDHRFHLLGIISWGIGCARPEYPGVYTRVPYFMDWIISKLRSNPSA